MKTTTKAIFSLGLISFLTLGGICQNAFAAEAKANNHHHSMMKKHTVKSHKVKSRKHKAAHGKKNISSIKHTSVNK
jgi:hypothetical protein